MWSRGKSLTLKGKETELANTLNDILRQVAPEATDNKKKHGVLEKFCAENMARPSNAKFMSYATFNKFMNGTHAAQKGIGTKQTKLIQAFIDVKRSTSQMAEPTNALSGVSTTAI